MDFPVIKPPCCFSSLRSTSLGLLFTNLIFSGYSVLSCLVELSNLTPRLEKIFGQELKLILFLNFLFAVVSCLIFFFTIMYFYKQSPSIQLLAASVFILILNVAYSLCLVIVLFCNGYVKRTFLAVNQYFAEIIYEDKHRQSEFVKEMEESGPSLVIAFFILAVVSYGFLLYTALILHSYKKELNHRPVYAIPPQQNNTFAPYPPNTQIVKSAVPHTNYFTSAA